MLYFFYAREVALITHGFCKDTRKVPPVEIKIAKEKRMRLLEDPESHVFHWERDYE